MTDDEIIKRAKEAEIGTDFGELVHSPISKGVNSAYGIGFIEGMVEYRNFLQKEPVNNDFEKALAEMIDKAQTSVVEPLVIAAQWKDELIKLAKSEEPVSEELEEAAFDYAEACKHDGGEKLLCVEHFKAGAKWQKERIMANSTNATIGLPYENKYGGYTHLIDVSRPLAVGNNKIAIIFKED